MASFLDKTILYIAAKRLKGPTVSSSFQEIYFRYLPLIKKCYKETGFWHGTGRFHYITDGKSKFEGNINYSHVSDSLTSIIESGGITPLYDPIPEYDTKYLKTISLTKYRFYARIYAEMNEYKTEKLKYEYGSDKFWFYLGVPLQLFYGNVLENLKVLAGFYFNKQAKVDARYWVRSFKKTSSKEYPTPLNFYELRSDIPQNYALLIGIRRHAVVPVHFDKLLERFETRTNKKIHLADISHFEVPLAHVEQTKSALAKHNVDIPVIPLECGDFYCSHYSLAFLIGVRN